MSKYDCSKCLDYVHEERRMCNGKDCKECVLEHHSGLCYVPDSQEKIDIVQKWSDENPEHPAKTILDDYKEKYPNYTHEINDTPVVCAGDLFGIAGTDGCDEDCAYCWNRPLSEVSK